MLRFLLGAAILAAAIAAVTKPDQHGFAPPALALLTEDAAIPALAQVFQGDCAEDPEGCAKALRAFFSVEESDYAVARGVRIEAQGLSTGAVDCVGVFGGWSCGADG